MNNSAFLLTMFCMIFILINIAMAFDWKATLITLCTVSGLILLGIGLYKLFCVIGI